jgi:protein-S-isoprenylcysteine O-methyltransferase Ste14
MEHKLLGYRPPRIAMLLLAAAASLHIVTPLGSIAVHPAKSIAVVTIVAGFSIMLWAWWQFRQHSVAICPTVHTERLITTGIYRLTRNPMYLGMIMMLAGVAAWFGSLPFVLATAVYFILINSVFCPYEERKLVAEFSEEYRRYAAQVGRWL